MRIGIPRESRPGETLVAATAKTAAQLGALGYDVVVEAGAGAAADQPDAAFTEAGDHGRLAPTTCGPATSWSRSTHPPTEEIAPAAPRRDGHLADRARPAAPSWSSS